MIAKSLLSIFIFLLLLIPLYLFIGTIDLKSHFFPLSQTQSSSLPCTSLQSSPLRVFMYDLPIRFNLGMINHQVRDGVKIDAGNFPPWPMSSGLKQQHSVEYWMMGSLIWDGGGDEREAIRVKDPEMADVFFVPFFSSTSFNTHGHNMTDPDTEIDRQLQTWEKIETV